MTDTDSLEIQQKLNAFYLRETSGPENFHKIPATSEYAAIYEIEDRWNAYEESRLDLTALPQTGEEFKQWYFKLNGDHRREVAPFFLHLARHASPEELAFYICLEEQVDGRFDDVIAMAQLGMVGDMKLALAENFWDEMGLGKLDDMHTIMFTRSAAYMREILVDANIDVNKAIPAAALKNGNLLLFYALRRRYLPRLLGALTLLEHTAPYRFAKTVEGLRRINMSEDMIAYHQLHVTIDANHGNALFNRVLQPLTLKRPEIIREVCIGCLIRRQVAVDYYRSIELAIEKFRPQLQERSFPVGRHSPAFISPQSP